MTSPNNFSLAVIDIPNIAHATTPAITIASLFPEWLGNCTAYNIFGAVGSDVYVTGRDGDVTVTSDGTGWTVATYASGAARCSHVRQ